MKQTHPDNIDETLAMLKQSADESVFKDWKVTDQMKDTLFKTIQQESTVVSMRQTRVSGRIAKASLVACAAIALIFVPPLFRSSHLSTANVQMPKNVASSATSTVRNNQSMIKSEVPETQPQQSQPEVQKTNPSIQDKAKKQYTPNSNFGTEVGKVKTYNYIVSSGQRTNQETVVKPKQLPTTSSGQNSVTGNSIGDTNTASSNDQNNKKTTDNKVQQGVLDNNLPAVNSLKLKATTASSSASDTVGGTNSVNGIQNNVIQKFNATSINPDDPIRQTIQELYSSHNLYGVHLKNGAVLLLTTKQSQAPYTGTVINAWPDPYLDLISKISDPMLYFQPAVSQLNWPDIHTHITWLIMSDQAWQQWNQNN